VLLLNTVLTVRAHQANSHAKKVRVCDRSVIALRDVNCGRAVATLHHTQPIFHLRDFLSLHPTIQVVVLRLVSPNAAPSLNVTSQGWEAFTDAAIAALSKRRSHVVFLLWGKPAQTKEKLINQVHCLE